MTSDTYFLISGLLTDELNDLAEPGTFSHLGDGASEAQEYRKAEIVEAQKDLDELYANQSPQ